MFEGPLSSNSTVVQRDLMAGRDPAGLGLHAPASVDAGKFTQKDVNALTGKYTAKISAGSGGPATPAVRPGTVAKPPNTLSRTDCENAVTASGGDFYILSRYAVCEADAEYVEFFVNGTLEGSLVYQRTIVGTAPGTTTLTTPRQLNWSFYIDSVSPIGTVDPEWTVVPTSALTVVTGTGNIQRTGTPPTGWTLTQMEAAGVEEWDSNFVAPRGTGAQPDDVYSDLVTFTITSLPGPGWTCVYCQPNTSQPFAMRWDNATYVPTPQQATNTGAGVFPYLVAVQYSTTGTEAAVAKHIALACTNPAATYPTNPAKAVPGCDTDHPLHRLLGKGTPDQSQYNANRRAAISTCRAQWGRGYSQGGALECDEFPFASTFEGASLKDSNGNRVNNFSAMPLAERDNGSAGSQLGNFYDWNRILRTQTDDGFYVQISGPGSPPPPPPPVDPATVGRVNASVLQASRIDSMSDAQLSAEMSDMVAEHMTTVVLDSVADSHNLATGTATAEYPTAQPGYTQISHTDVVGRLLSAAYIAGLRVLIGLPTDDQWHSQWANNAAWLQAEAATDTAFADELWSTYSVWSSFDGWYLPLTVDNVHFGTTAAQANLVNYYNSVTGELRTLSGDAQVAIAPTFDAVDTTLTGWQNSTAYAALWQNILPQVDLDSVALQDGVGDQHASAGTLGSWYSAMSAAVTAAGSSADLYADTQTYLDTPEGGTVPMGVKTVVADLGAAEPSVVYNWSSSYGDYLSPDSVFGAATNSYAAAYAAWAKTGTGDGSDGGAPPSTPTGVTATALDSQTVKVSWNASTDPALPIAGYTVIRNGQPVATLVGSATSFTDGQLIGSTAYTYKIQAFDGAGNTSAASGNVTATTSATPSTGTNYARCGAATGKPGCPYTATIPADPAYPDTGGVSLTDGGLGTTALGSAWQGRDGIGSYSFTVDLGTTRTFTQIKTDWLQLRQDSVWDSFYLPASLTYAISTNGTTWQTLTVTSTQPNTNATTQTKTYKALGLNATARYVKVTVNAGPAWSALDEIQIYGS